MTWLLDTNVVSEMRKIRSGRADANVTAWVRARRRTDLYLSAVTVHELELGVQLAQARDPHQGAILRSWLEDSVLAAFDERILPVDTTVARTAAGFHVPDPAPFRDAFIGATALVHAMTVATRNTADFTRFTGLLVVNPWLAA
jgi:predicted nucleic acid-binding protein